MPEPGWYSDEHDPDVARWHDGVRWTAHTVRKASWTGSNRPPPPGAEATRSGDASTTTCPWCAETILAAARKCRYCGELQGLAPALAVVPDAAPPGPADRIDPPFGSIGARWQRCPVHGVAGCTDCARARSQTSPDAGEAAYWQPPTRNAEDTSGPTRPRACPGCQSSDLIERHTRGKALSGLLGSVIEITCGACGLTLPRR